MQLDFHYYATYCAAYLAGYSHEESMDICYSAQFVDMCSGTLLKKIRGPVEAATTQLQAELMDARTDYLGLMNITRIWSSFHFLPKDLNANVKGSRRYQNKYRLICGPNGALLSETIETAKGKGLEAAGIAMHILADTWAHQYFAGTPSYIINNTDYHFYEIVGQGDDREVRRIRFSHNPKLVDDPVKGIYVNSVSSGGENNVMCLGHGKAGHLPDYSFARYKYLPAWGNYQEITKDNPSDYMHAFCQMIYALRYLKGDFDAFERDTYDTERVAPYREEIDAILERRQLSALSDWKEFGERLSGSEIEDFDIRKYQKEYLDAPKGEKDQTYLGRFIRAAIAQKTRVSNSISASGNRLAGLGLEVKHRDKD